MTKEEYDNEMKILEQEHWNKKKGLMRKCAYSNNSFKEGDLFTDHIGTVEIETIGVYNPGFGELPCCTYTGLELKKDGKPTKKRTRRTAYQSNQLKTIQL